MGKKLLSLLGIMALAIGVTVFVAPGPSHAVLITSVSVTVGATTYCGDAAVAPCAGNDIWDIPAGGILVAPGDDLILAQTSGFNFDTSEGNLPACSFLFPCFTSVTINGVLVVNAVAASVLAAGNGDDGSINFNEAADYVLAATVPSSYQLFFGYADNVHIFACADASGNCQPDPFDGPFAVGTGLPIGFVEVNPNHCAAGLGNCFDSGVLRIVGLPGETTVPAASTLVLLGTGLMGVAAWSRRRL